MGAREAESNRARIIRTSLGKSAMQGKQKTAALANDALPEPPFRSPRKAPLANTAAQLIKKDKNVRLAGTKT